MKSFLATVSLLAILALVTVGCGQQSEAQSESPALCGQCGQVKGADVCCAKDAVTCDECQLVKGSPGCCKIEKGADVALCAKCGQVKGADACCAEGAEKCDKCQLTKGSPGCCKIKG